MSVILVWSNLVKKNKKGTYGVADIFRESSWRELCFY